MLLGQVAVVMLLFCCKSTTDCNTKHSGLHDNTVEGFVSHLYVNNKLEKLHDFDAGYKQNISSSNQY